MRGRALKQKPPSIQTPANAQEWNALIRQAIERAERLGDRRVHGLRKALVDGASERHLRMLSIIHPGDLQREFPEKD